MSRIDELIMEHCPAGVRYMPLGETCQIKNGRDWKTQEPGQIPVYGSGGRMNVTVKQPAYHQPTVLLPRKGSLNVQYVSEPFWNVDTVFYTICDLQLIEPKFLFHYMKTVDLGPISTSSTRPSLTQTALAKIRIPVPPLGIQRAIVDILDKFTKLEADLEAELEAELEARKKRYDYYRWQLLEFDDSVERVELGTIAEYVNGKAHERFVEEDGTIPLVTARFVSRNGEANRFVNVDNIKTSVIAGDIALVLSDLPNGRALARTFYVDEGDKYAINQRVARIRVADLERVSSRYLSYVLDRNQGLLKYDNGFDQTHLSKAQVIGLQIPLPPINEQLRIAGILDQFDVVVNDLSSVLSAEIAARRKQYEYYRDQLLTFKELAS